MVEILTRGTPPEEVIHVVTCKNCNSKLRCKEGEVKKMEDPSNREPTWRYITCPVCSQKISMSAPKNGAQMSSWNDWKD
jgi:transcription elongation factor Elf1